MDKYSKNYQLNQLIRPRKNMCGSGYPTYPKYLPLTFFSPNSEVGRE